MRLLITGGLGFIGSNFIRYIIKKYPNYKVVNLDAETYAGNPANLSDIENNPNYTFIKRNICDAKIVNKSMKGVDIVVHFAAESHVDRSILGPAIFIQTNVIGTQVLLDVALEKKVKRFHHVSTDEIFGALTLEEKRKFREDTPYDPRSPYAASKAAADHLVRAYYHTYGLPITISNCSNNFGPFQFPEKIISLAITNVLEGKKIPIYGDGLYVRDWIYVEDHCRGIDLILEKGKIGETYLIGADNELANIDLAKKILKILGKDESFIEYVKDRPGHDRRYAIDATKIKKELGFRPRFNFEDALKSTIEWYKNNQSWWRKIRTGEYLNYYKKQYGRA